MKKNKQNLALTGWATWWHIFPLLSAYNYLKEDNIYKFFWVWERHSLEEDIAEEHDIEFLVAPAWKIRRYFDLRNFYEPFKNLTWIVYSIYYILKYKIDIIFSKWWYVSLPLCIAGFLLRKKIYIHESDTIWGISNKIISKIATKVFYTFPNEKTKLWGKYITSWQILNPELLDSVKDIKVVENEKLEILVIAWSQGSTRIFEWLIKILPDFEDINFTIILWNKNLSFAEKFIKFQNVKTLDFVAQEKLWNIYKKSDIAITRWWATTLFELSAFWIHSIIVPLTESAWWHQQKNAEFFHKKYGSDIVDENKDFEIELYRKIKKYKTMRKKELNLDNFYEALKIIEKEMLK